MFFTGIPASFAETMTSGHNNPYNNPRHSIPPGPQGFLKHLVSSLRMDATMFLTDVIITTTSMEVSWGSFGPEVNPETHEEKVGEEEQQP